MEAIRKYVTVKNNSIQLILPKEYNTRQVEVIILPVNGQEKNKTNDFKELKKKWESFIAKLPTKEPSISDEEIIAEVKKVRAAFTISPKN